MSEKAPDAPPELMSVACARFFASDWELSSLLEFLGDLRLRAADALAQSVGVVARRLSDHLILVLQLVVVRSTDNYFAYLRDVRESIEQARTGSPEHFSIVVTGWESVRLHATEPTMRSDLDTFANALSTSSAVKLASAFFDATGLGLFESTDDADTLSRLLAVRNVVSHNRTLASRAFSELLDDVPSAELGVDWKRVRADLLFLRRSVRRIDDQAALKWSIDRPITRSSFVKTCRHAAMGEPFSQDAHPLLASADDVAGDAAPM